MKRQILIYGACGGLLIVLLQLVEYRFLVIEHSLEIYGALVAAIFAGVGIWLGLKLTRKERVVVVKEVPTVKTHSSRLFEKLGAKRRTQAVQIGKALGLIP